LGGGYRSKRKQKKKKEQPKIIQSKKLEDFTKGKRGKIAKETIKFAAEILFDYYGLSFLTTAIEATVKAYKTYTKTGSIQEAVKTGISTAAIKIYSDNVAKGVMEAVGIKGTKLMRKIIEKALSRTFEEIAEKTTKRKQNE